MIVALLGADGMLGSRMARVLEGSGHRVLAPSLGEADLEKPATLEAFFAGNAFDGLFNCAAFTAVDDCETPVVYDKALRINGQAVGVLGALSKRLDRWMVHVSTDYVFNGEKPSPYDEGDATDPVNAYGRTKLAGEEALRSSGAKAWIVRTSWLYGPNGKNFVRTIAELLRKKDRIEVVDDQVGGPTYTGDLARFLPALPERKAPFGTYHYAGEGFTSWHGFATAIRDVLGVSCEVAPVDSGRFPRPAQRPKNSRFDLSKARGTAGELLRPWRDSLSQYLAEEGL